MHEKELRKAALIFLAVLSFPMNSVPCPTKVKNLFSSNRDRSYSPKLISTTRRALKISPEETMYIKYSRNKRSELSVMAKDTSDSSSGVELVKNGQSMPPILKDIVYNPTLKTEFSIFHKELNGSNSDVESEELTEFTQDDLNVQHEWGGQCRKKHWDRCNILKLIIVENAQINATDEKDRHLEINCWEEQTICLHNDWTVNRCHILCMARCNRNMLYSWEEFVSYDGACRYF